MDDLTEQEMREMARYYQRLEERRLHEQRRLRAMKRVYKLVRKAREQS